MLKSPLNLIAFIILITTSSTGFAMSFFEGKEAFLFSDVTGYLTYENKPASQTTVHRLVEIDGESFEDITKTDDEGFFSFDAMTKKYRSILPKEFVSHQKLIAEYNGKDFLIWETVKRSEEKNAELEGKPLNFKCELTDDTRFVHMMLHSVGTNCTWEN